MTTTPALWATRTAADAPALIEFLERAFGFVTTARYDDESGGVAHAELVWPQGTGGLMLGTRREDGDWPQPAGFGAYVVVEDVEALHERAVAAGAEVLYPPRDTDYGSREAAYRDPDGGMWSFGTYAGTGLPG